MVMFEVNSEDILTKAGLIKSEKNGWYINSDLIGCLYHAGSDDSAITKIELITPVILLHKETTSLDDRLDAEAHVSKNLMRAIALHVVNTSITLFAVPNLITLSHNGTLVVAFDELIVKGHITIDCNGSSVERRTKVPYGDFIYNYLDTVH